MVATILLVAFTTIVGTFLFSWSKLFSTSTLESAQQCSPFISIESLKFSDGKVSITLYNPNSYTAFKGMRVSLLYEDSTKNMENVNLSAYGIKDPLEIADFTSAVVNTSDTAKPQKAMVTSKNCPNAVAERKFL